MNLCNYWEEQFFSDDKAGQSFQSIPGAFEPKDRRLDGTWRRIVPLVAELRNSPTCSIYKQDSVDAATMAASVFISRMPDSILEMKRLIDFDVELDESVEFIFQGRQKVRVNLMLKSMKTKEEAFILYQRNDRLTQSNGYMAEVVEILKRVL